MTQQSEEIWSRYFEFFTNYRGDVFEDSFIQILKKAFTDTELKTAYE
jgi:hypothetical protein